jgi:hypothetical protein
MPVRSRRLPTLQAASGEGLRPPAGSRLCRRVPLNGSYQTRVGARTVTNTGFIRAFCEFMGTTLLGVSATQP